MIQTKKRSWKCSACPSRNEGTAKKCVCGTRKGTKLKSVDARWDGLLRKWTLARANHICERCLIPASSLTGESHLEDAHYERRGKKATRWHPDNRAALCVGPHERHGGCHRIIDNFTPAHERRIFFASLRGEEAIAEVDELVRNPWDKDRGAIIALLVERGVMTAKAAAKEQSGS